MLKLEKVATTLLGEDKVKQTKAKIAKAFADLGAPVPDEMEAPVEVGKVDEKLIHVGVQHLYMGALENLEASKTHLLKLIKKHNSEVASSVLPIVQLLIDETKTTVDLIAKSVDEMPSVEDLDTLFAQLKQEAENAKLLQIMNVDVEKAKMH